MHTQLTNILLILFQSVIYSLTKRQSQDDKLGSSRAVAEANKQLTRTCIVVTIIFIITIGEKNNFA